MKLCLAKISKNRPQLQNYNTSFPLSIPLGSKKAAITSHGPEFQTFFFTVAALIMSMNSGCKRIVDRRVSQPKLWTRNHISQNNDFKREINTLREAPPTKNPSTSGCAASSLQFAPFTEPTVDILLVRT